MAGRHNISRVIGMWALGFVAIGLLGLEAHRAWGQGAVRGGDKTGVIRYGGRERTYIVHVPPAYDRTKPAPLVLVLHGAGQSFDTAEKMSGMSLEADKEDFLVAYPRGTGHLKEEPTWNSGNCCGYAMRNNVDDVGFIRALVAQLKKDYAVDSKRVYVTGVSNGAMMSYRLGCEVSDQIAAIAPVEGAQNVDCKPASPVSVIVFHGTADRLVPFDGGTARDQTGPQRTDNSVAGAVSFWVKQDGCSPTPQHEETSEVHTDVYSGCKDGTGVALYAIQGGRHKWPGASLSGNHVRATEIMWDFFAQHAKR